MNKISDLLKDADPLQQESQSQEESRREAARRVILAAASTGPLSAAPKRRPVRFIAAALIAAGLLILGARLWTSIVIPTHAAVPFEVRLGELQAAAGLREARVQGDGKVVYVHDEIIVSNADIARAYLIEDGSPPQFGVGIDFTTAGAEKMRAATGEHLGRPVAIIVDNQIVMAPVLKSSLGGSAVITGQFTRAQAERIVEGLR